MEYPRYRLVLVSPQRRRLSQFFASQTVEVFAARPGKWNVVKIHVFDSSGWKFNTDPKGFF